VLGPLTVRDGFAVVSRLAQFKSWKVWLRVSAAVTALPYR